MKKRVILIYLILGVSTPLVAQVMVLHDPVSSRTFNAEKYSGMKGSPFLYDKWIPGTVTTFRGIYKNLELKLDAYNNTLYFNKDDQPYEFQEEIKSFTLITPDTLYYRRGASEKNLTPDQYIQVLAEGKIGLYRSDIKMVSELNEVNSGTIKSFTDVHRYYLTKDAKTELVKLNKTEIFEFIKDKEEQVKAFIAEHKLSTKKEADFVRILKYYNSL